jgi:rare lipoprotein A
VIDKWIWRCLAFTIVALIVGLLLTPRPADAAAASCYGPGLYGNHTASGLTLWPTTIGLAHRTLPLGTRLHVRAAGRTMTMRVIDRGPFVAGRHLDLTAGAAARLGFHSCSAWGVRNVRTWRAA